MQIEILIRSFLDGAYDERLLDIYADEAKISTRGNAISMQ